MYALRRYTIAVERSTFVLLNPLQKEPIQSILRRYEDGCRYNLVSGLIREKICLLFYTRIRVQGEKVSEYLL